MSWNEHLTKDERGTYFCSYFKVCLDCEYDDNCLCQDQIRKEIDLISEGSRQ